MLAYGAISHEYTGRKSSDGQNNVAGELTFDASRCSSVFGKSSEIQPPSGKVLWIIKV